MRTSSCGFERNDCVKANGAQSFLPRSMRLGRRRIAAASTDHSCRAGDLCARRNESAHRGDVALPTRVETLHVYRSRPHRSHSPDRASRLAAARQNGGLTPSSSAAPTRIRRRTELLSATVPGDLYATPFRGTRPSNGSRPTHTEIAGQQYADLCRRRRSCEEKALSGVAPKLAYRVQLCL